MESSSSLLTSSLSHLTLKSDHIQEEYEYNHNDPPITQEEIDSFLSSYDKPIVFKTDEDRILHESKNNPMCPLFDDNEWCRSYFDKLDEAKLLIEQYELNLRQNPLAVRKCDHIRIKMLKKLYPKLQKLNNQSILLTDKKRKQ